VTYLNVGGMLKEKIGQYMGVKSSKTGLMVLRVDSGSESPS